MFMKKFLCILTAIIILAVLFAGCENQTPASYNTPGDLPENVNLVFLTDMKYDKSQKLYYVSVKAGTTADNKTAEKISEEIYNFLVADKDEFYAYGWTPGWDGLTSRDGYASADAFNENWFIPAKKLGLGYEEEPFWFSFNENGQIESLNQFYDLSGYIPGYDDD
jgi:hypothetical protein